MNFFVFLFSVHLLLFSSEKEILDPFGFHQNKNFSRQNILIAGMENLPEYDNRESGEPGLVDYFSNIVFENTLCKCGGPSRCTRGCVRNGVFPQLRCYGRRTKRERCTRYVHAAIMNTVYAFFDEHCPPFDSDSCDKMKAGQGTLCDQGFIFPSALCLLSLDGEDRYKIIEKRSVRSGCKGWFRHNKNLIFVDVLTETGENLTIPLFQRIDMPEYLGDLPKGSIIVSKSDSVHGHVEIKTDKKECGRDGKDTCFCSDFCTSRKGGYRWPFRPQTVFQWNPEFVYYFEKNGQSI